MIERLTDLIADLDSPFYSEERQRDVWNEASAVGFQTMLWGGLVLSCAMVWIGGLVGWTIALLAVIAVAAWLTIGHANRRGVEGTEGVSFRTPRMFLAGALYAATVVGLVVRVQPDAATLAGALVGMVLVIALVAVSRRSRRA